jgi:hypothetical protein
MNPIHQLRIHLLLKDGMPKKKDVLMRRPDNPIHQYQNFFTEVGTCQANGHVRNLRPTHHFRKSHSYKNHYITSALREKNFGCELKVPYYVKFSGCYFDSNLSPTGRQVDLKQTLAALTARSPGKNHIKNMEAQRLGFFLPGVLPIRMASGVTSTNSPL